ncbi:Stp1/IreP family PP2C-type Ser/Thr phosphatase [Provencibacterium massiliense]|uniref:Stp1/IreP family PP2C-type Ser/Thr phosphatase n=1 Tax=Provencibacterium massiliense TaxID=1841868 RepID=UPI0013567030|nr:Stp1/IreP family PP2C-type Ser/Thr phosphatase [Provencibacterium massiliense]
MLKATGLTHKGTVRAQNQDVFRLKVLGESLGYAMVCDGMGGEKAGDIASLATIEMIDRYLKKGLTPQLPLNSVRSLIMTAVSAANAVVYEQAQKDERFHGMGTTLVMAIVSGQTLHICHVGDSRIYLVHGGETLQLTKDHSMVQMLVDKGELSQSEADTHPKKHYITRAIGVAPRVEPDYAEYPFGQGQVLLLCSDGLSNYLPQEQVAEEVMKCVRQHSAAPLIDYALAAGGADNVTAVILTDE